MTVVLPAPVASFSARRARPGFAFGVDEIQMLQNAFSRRDMRGDFGKPDNRFDRFHLAEKGANSHKFVSAPVGEETRGFRRHLPVYGVFNLSPFADVLPHIIYHAVDVVALRRVGNLLGERILKKRPFLLAVLSFFAWLGDRGDEIGDAARRDDPLRRLAATVQFPMARRQLVGRVENRVIKKWIILRLRHCAAFSE